MTPERFAIELEQQKALAEKLHYFMRGNIDAVRFCIDLTYLCHLWDDLIDKDVQRSDSEINAAFRVALVDIPLNPFYIQNQMHIRPLFMNMILHWQSANVLERGSDHDKHIAYVIRTAFIQVFVYCAYLIGGPAWAEQVGPEIWRLYEEKLEDFLKEIDKCLVQ